jgi:murein DD-endopeptidase MepM/ murein hydrolase activator NlpD
MLRSNILPGLVRWLRRHAAADRNSITVTIAPAQAERTFQIDLPRWSLRLVGAILVASFVLVLAGGILYGKLIHDAVVLREVRQENEILRARAARLSEIEEDVAQLDRVRKQLYALAGVTEAEAGTPGAEDQAPAGPARDDRSAPGTIDGAPDSEVDASLGGGSGETTESPLIAVPFRGPLSRGFSIASDKNPEHSGVDVAGREGADVVAAADGMVTFAGQDETFGNMVIVRHAGWETRYGHNMSLLVGVGTVSEPDRRSRSWAARERARRRHLHFEVHLEEAVDPGDVFRPTGRGFRRAGERN